MRVAALVLLVVPEARLHIVWDEIVIRCKSKEISVGNVQKTTSMISAEIRERHYLAATSWSVLLDALSTAAASASEIDSRNDIAQLVGLSERWRKKRSCRFVVRN